jgi:hypothetical protein
LVVQNADKPFVPARHQVVTAWLAMEVPRRLSLRDPLYLDGDRVIFA